MSLKYEVLLSGQRKKVIFFGSLDETVRGTLNGLHQVDGLDILFNFKYLENINSLGIRNWILFIKQFSVERKIIFEECPFHLVNVLNMHPSFRGGGKISSFYGDFVCEGCNEDIPKLFTVSEGIEKIEEEIRNAKCPNCGESMVLSEFEDAFLSFLTE